MRRLALLSARLDALAVAAGDPVAMGRHRRRLVDADSALEADTLAGWRGVRPAPWPDPSSRDAHYLADERRSELGAAFGERVARTRALADQAVRIRRGLTALDRLAASIGVVTTAVRAVRQAERAAREASDDLALDRDELRARTAEAGEQGRREAGRRSREQGAWDRLPEVAAARERERRNVVAARLLGDGDPDMMVIMIEGGPASARDEVARREAPAPRGWQPPQPPTPAASGRR